MCMDSLIANALRQYGIADYDAEILNSNESLAAKITDRESGRAYLLRVHVPPVGGMLGVQHTFEGLAAEMVFRSALARSTGLALQEHVADQAGSYISSIVDTANHRSLLCSLLTWVDGSGLDGHEECAPALVRQFGATIAEMHRFAAGWEIPAPFIRPVYDNQKYAHLVSRLAHGVSTGLFSAADYEVFLQVRRKTAQLLENLPRSADRWGIIHADLHTGNLIVSGGRIIPIDFSFSGYGYYLFDLSICYSSLSAELRPYLLEGYRAVRPVSEDDLTLLDAFFIEGIIGAFGLHIFNDRKRDWIARRLPQVAATYCADYLAGRPVAR